MNAPRAKGPATRRQLTTRQRSILERMTQGWSIRFWGTITLVAPAGTTGLRRLGTLDFLPLLADGLIALRPSTDPEIRYYDLTDAGRQALGDRP